MDDLISRQVAIDAINKAFERVFAWDGTSPLGDKVLENVPSAQPEPCEDAVSRKAVYDAMVEKGQRSRRYKLGEIWELNGTEIREALDTVPSVTPKRKRGKWIDETFKPWGLVYHPYRCDQCGEHSEADSNFCPNCGADMRGEQDDSISD